MMYIMAMRILKKWREFKTKRIGNKVARKLAMEISRASNTASQNLKNPNMQKPQDDREVSSEGSNGEI